MELGTQVLKLSALTVSLLFFPLFLLLKDPKGSWQSGFFDHGSFMEIMQPWAQSVVVGRARYVSNKTKTLLHHCLRLLKHILSVSVISVLNYRLGGIPTGVVAVETRSVELSIPADPANLDSEAKVISTQREQVQKYLYTKSY